MAVDNLLYIDDNDTVRPLVLERFRNELTENVDTASSYQAWLDLMKAKFYDLIVVDGLHGKCFRLAEDAKAIRHGQIVIFSFSPGLAEPARILKVPFYKKPEDLGRLISDYGGKK